MNNEDLQKLKAAAKGCDGWAWPDRRRDENGTHHFGKRTEDGEFHDMGTIDAWTYTSDYADDLRVLKFIRQAQPKDILALIAEVEQARAANGDRQALEKAAAALQQFKRDWMAVPAFADRVNKHTRDAISRAIGPLVNLDAVGGPLDLSKSQ